MCRRDLPVIASEPLQCLNSATCAYILELRPLFCSIILVENLDPNIRSLLRFLSNFLFLCLRMRFDVSFRHMNAFSAFLTPVSGNGLPSLVALSSISARLDVVQNAIDVQYDLVSLADALASVPSNAESLWMPVHTNVAFD